MHTRFRVGLLLFASLILSLPAHAQQQINGAIIAPGTIPIGALGTTGTASASTWLNGIFGWMPLPVGSTTRQGIVEADGTTVLASGGVLSVAPATGGTPGIIDLAGDLTGTYNAPVLRTTGVTAGSYGDGTDVAIFTVNGKGQLTAAGTTPIPTATNATNGLSRPDGTTITVNGSGQLTATVASATPSGSAGGDLGGTYPSPKVTGIQGISVSATTPTTGQVLQLASGIWVPTTLTASSVGAEPALGNPGVNGYVLSSTTAGGRSWIAPATGTGTVTSVTSTTAYPGMTDTVTSGTTTPVVALTATTGLTGNQFVGTPASGTGAVALRSIASADLPIATTSLVGAVKPDGSTITINGSGVISAAAPGALYVVSTLPTASSSNRGNLYLVQRQTGYTYETSINSDSPSHYWKFNEGSGTTASDSIGSFNFTINSGVTLGQTGWGSTADSYTSYLFNGTSGYLSNASYIQNTPSGSFSFDGWFKTGSSTSSVQVLLCTTNSAQTQGWAFYVNSGQLRFGVYNSGGQTTLTGSSLSASTWYHLGFTYSNGSTAIYVNGVSVATGSTAFTAVSSGSGTWSGQYSGSGGDYWTGNMQQLAFYPSALSATRILAHYNAGYGGSITDKLYCSISGASGYAMQNIF